MNDQDHKKQLADFEKQQMDYFNSIDLRIDMKKLNEETFWYKPLNIKNLQQEGWDTSDSHISDQIDGSKAEIIRARKGDMTLQWGFGKWIISTEESATLFCGSIPNIFTFRFILGLVG